MSENKGVLVYCEVIGDQLSTFSAELLGAGGRLATALGQELKAVLLGSGITGLAQEIIANGANKVYVADDPIMKDYSSEHYLKVMERVIRTDLPAIVLLGHSYIGRELAPWLGFRLSTGVTMDCLALEIDPSSKRMLMTRPVYGGNAQVVQVCQVDPQIATVRFKAMDQAVKNSTLKGQIINIEAGVDPPSLKAKVVDRRIETSAGIKLEDARIIVAGGRGIGSAAGFKKLEELAGVLKAAVGASRPPCDRKWVADSQQIGLTGKVVSPDLYIAVGLSGASQHVSGFSNARVIVAINKEPKANIFKIADYGIISDWESIISAFTAKLKEALTN
jgi:electron transfer flavoprotein alpha subunit